MKLFYLLCYCKKVVEGLGDFLGDIKNKSGKSPNKSGNLESLEKFS